MILILLINKYSTDNIYEDNRFEQQNELDE